MLDNNVTFITGYSYRVKSPNDVPLYAHEVSMGDKDVAVRIVDQDFASKAAISLDELFVPYSTTEDDILYSSMNENPRVDLSFTGPQRPNNFCSGYYRTEVLSYDMRSGMFIGISTTFGDTIASDMGEVYNKEDSEDIRSMGLRAPFMMAGFGYDTEGFPVPSYYEDIVAASGEGFYQDEIDEAKEDYSGSDDISNLIAVRKAEARADWDKRTFSRKFRERQDLWKAGPFDVRWDRHKEMWVAAPEVFQGYAMYDIPAASGRFAPNPFTSGEVAILTGRFKEGTTCEPYSKLLLINRSITLNIASGAFLSVIRAGNGEYVPLHVDCISDKSGVYFRTDD